MGSYKVEQRQLSHRGRMFHFVSYEGQRAKPASGQLASPSAWFLMNEGTRWEVMLHVVGEEPAELDRRLLEWLKHTLSHS